MRFINSASILLLITLSLIPLTIHPQDEITTDEGDDVETVEANTFTSWEFGISFTIPDNFERQKRPGYLIIIKDTKNNLEFSIKVRLLSEIIPIDQFVSRMESEMNLKDGFERHDLKELIKDNEFWSGELTIPTDGTEWSNPYEILLYDDTPDEELLAKIKKEMEKVKGGDEEIFLPVQTEATYLYDDVSGSGGVGRQVVVYCIKGNVGYAFDMKTMKDSFSANIPAFNDILRDIDIRNIYGGQYGITEVIEIDVENTGVISGKVLHNGITIPDATIFLYNNYNDFKSGNYLKSIKSNYYGEYWFVEIEPGESFIIDAVFSGDGSSLRAYSPIDRIEVNKGKVTFVNIELIE